MKHSTKAQNLIILDKLNLKKSFVPNFYKFFVYEWISKREKIIKKINNDLKDKIIIRSSYYLEDGKNYSMAGEFDGAANVYNKKSAIIRSVNKLLKQYKNKSLKKTHLYNSEIIVQDMIQKTILSGVATNYCMKDGSDYYVINYDDISGLTSTVTSGSKMGGRVINIYKNETSGLRSKKFNKIIESIKEIEKKIGQQPIDLEFGIDRNYKVNLFQIRPITTLKKIKNIPKVNLDNVLRKNQKFFLKIYKKNSKFGNIPSFGLMPDWNPVEMIGYQPSRLSYSLYSKLITDSAWSKSREEMGYQKIERPLMYKFTGKPYIDARLSFSSLIPKEINLRIRKKIVNFWSQILNLKPYLHDKIEFEIADGSYDINLKKKIYKKYLFLSLKEKKTYFESLKKLTSNQIENFDVEYKKFNLKLKNLESKRIDIINIFLQKEKNFKKNFKIFFYLIRDHGIIPFAKYARNAFIGKKFLNSLKKEKILNEKKINLILNSLETITTTYLNISKKKGKKNHDIYRNYFYHLRPGTYDITISRNLKKLSQYKIDNFNSILDISKDYSYLLSKNEKKKINSYLKKENFTFDSKKLINYIIQSLRLRENSKFIFTRALSDFLQIIENKGKNKKIDLESLSKLDVTKIINDPDLRNIKKTSKKISFKEKFDELCKLPYLITSKADFFIASILISKPNFITNEVINSKIIKIKKNQITEKINKKIVLIENADPGFDWIFNYKINGLITKYGGVNSHMSIRCHELNIPAAIGLGDESFEKLINQKRIILNCKEKKIYTD